MPKFFEIQGLSCVIIISKLGMATCLFVTQPSDNCMFLRTLNINFDCVDWSIGIAFTKWWVPDHVKWLMVFHTNLNQEEAALFTFSCNYCKRFYGVFPPIWHTPSVQRTERVWGYWFFNTVGRLLLLCSKVSLLYWCGCSDAVLRVWMVDWFKLFLILFERNLF